MRSTSPTSRIGTNSTLETLLVDLGSQIQRAASIPHDHERDKEEQGTGASSLGAFGAPRSRYCATGWTALDTRLGGGFPYGRLSEICGPPSSGRTALALGLIGNALGRGGLASWIDWPDTFDPLSASASGVPLERLLWVRPRSKKQALQSCDRLLRTQGFGLVVFDCVATRRPATASGLTPPGRRRSLAPSIPDVAWLRLSRLAAQTRTALVVLSQPTPFPPRFAGHDATPPSMTGSRAALVLEMLPLNAHFAASPNLLESLETTAIVRRHRTRSSGGAVPLFVPARESVGGPCKAAKKIHSQIEPRR